MRRDYFLPLTAIAIALAIIVVGVPLPSGSRYWEQIENSAHIFFFAFISFVLIKFLRGVQRLNDRNDLYIAFMTLAACISLGAATEIAQRYVPGRDSNIYDAIRDTVGTVAGIALWGFVQSRKRKLPRRRTLKVTLMSLTLISLAVGVEPIVEWQLAFRHRDTQFPVICSFDSFLEKFFMTPHECQISFVPGASEQSWSVAGNNQVGQFDFEPGEYPGVTFDEIKADWDGYDSLCFEVYSDRTESINLGVRIDDVSHNYQSDDRYTEEFTIAQGHSTISIPLARVQHAPHARLLDVKQIARIIIFLDHPGKELRLYLDNLRLR